MNKFIKSCPICGRMPVFKRDSGYETSAFGAWCTIYCKPYFRTHLKVEQGKSSWARALDCAVEEWNRRVEDEKYYLTTND